MKKFIALFYCLSLIYPLHGETLFGLGTIVVATNETILITDVGPGAAAEMDGVIWTFESRFRYALTGPLTLTNLEDGYVTFQRLQGSSVKSVKVTGTNVIEVPGGKTIQFFDTIAGDDVRIALHPFGSTNVYDFPLFEHRPTLTGPVSIEVYLTAGAQQGAFVSYYFTDEILQIPPGGLTKSPASVLEINVEKSYNLTNWIPTATFNTEAEAQAYYRLRILK